MASPFSLFRKHQKVMMMSACLLAIIAFVFLTPLTYLIGKKSGTSEDLVVVKTKKYGDLRQSDIERLRWKKLKVQAVLIELGQEAINDPRITPKAVEEAVKRRFGSTDDALVDTWLKVQRAREIGMVVSDDTVTRFLEGWTDHRVPIDKIQDAFRHTPAVSDAQFYDLLRDELLAQQLVTTFVPSIEIGDQPIATPSQRWDWFNRVNRMAVIEAVPLAVADYEKDVEKPTDEVLTKFFEDNKDAIAYPASPKPGFKRPQKVAIEYFKADIDKFAATVTDAEVRREYEKNKDAYDRYFRIPPAPQPAKQGAAKGADNAKKATEVKPEAKPEAKATGNVPKARTKEGASKESPKAAKPKEPNKTQDSKGASSAVRTTPFMLTAMQQVEKKAADKPKSPAASEPAANAESPAKPAPTAKPAKPAAKEEKAGTKKAASEKEPEEPNDQVPDAVKTFIRRQLAFEKIEKAFADLRKPVDEYQQDCRKYDLRKIQFEREKKKVPPPPVGPNFEKLAKEHGMSTGRTKLVPAWQMQNTDVGASLIVRKEGQLPVWAYIYQAPKFRCEWAIDGHSAYLFWKSDEAKEYVPKFDDKGVREEVLHSWKMIEARSIAKKAAKSLADEAEKTGKPLKQVIRNHLDLRVVLPPKFSWMTMSNVALASQQRPQARLSPVAGVNMAGDDFMATVFQLEPGQAGVAFNTPETVVYVVRPSEFTPSYEVRWKLFLADSFTTYAAAGVTDQSRVLNAWFEEIKKSAGFEWGPGHKAEEAGESSRGTQRQQPMDDED